MPRSDYDDRFDGQSTTRVRRDGRQYHDDYSDDRDDPRSQGGARASRPYSQQQSIERGETLTLPPTPHVRYPSPRQRIDRPPVRREPKLVEAHPASE